MARIRSVHPKLFMDERFVALSPPARLVLIGLGTFSDYADSFPWDEGKISGHLGDWSLAHLPELLAAGLIVRAGFRGEIRFAFGFSRQRITRWERLRSIVFRRDNYTCRYCGSRQEPLHCDHVIPASRGGAHTTDNLVAACQPCNLSKGDRTPEEWCA